jgi:hypothetical protein
VVERFRGRLRRRSPLGAASLWNRVGVPNTEVEISIVVRYAPVPSAIEQYDEVIRRLRESGELPAEGFDYHVAFHPDGQGPRAMRCATAGAHDLAPRRLDLLELEGAVEVHPARLGSGRGGPASFPGLAPRRLLALRGPSLIMTAPCSEVRGGTDPYSSSVTRGS